MGHAHGVHLGEHTLEVEPLVGDHRPIQDLVMRLSVVLFVFRVRGSRYKAGHFGAIDLLDEEAWDETPPVQMRRRPSLPNAESESGRKRRQGQPTLVARVGPISDATNGARKPCGHDSAGEFRGPSCRIGLVAAEEFVSSITGEHDGTVLANCTGEFVERERSGVGALTIEMMYDGPEGGLEVVCRIRRNDPVRQPRSPGDLARRIGLVVTAFAEARSKQRRLQSTAAER